MLTDPLFNVFVGVVALGAFLASLWMIREAYRTSVRYYREFFVWRPVRRRGEEMVRRAKFYVQIHGPLAVQNKAKKGVTAVARYDKFNARLLEVLRRAAGARNTEPMCQRVFVDVVPTFTFADNEAVHFPAHTGLKRDIDDLMSWIVAKITDIGKAEVDKRSYEEAVLILAVRDQRLLIPFEYEEPLHTVEGEFKKFGGTTLQQAEEQFVPPFPNTSTFDTSADE